MFAFLIQHQLPVGKTFFDASCSLPSLVQC